MAAMCHSKRFLREASTPNSKDLSFSLSIFYRLLPSSPLFGEEREQKKEGNWPDYPFWKNGRKERRKYDEYYPYTVRTLYSPFFHNWKIWNGNKLIWAFSAYRAYMEIFR